MINRFSMHKALNLHPGAKRHLKITHMRSSFTAIRSLSACCSSSERTCLSTVIFILQYQKTVVMSTVLGCCRRRKGMMSLIYWISGLLAWLVDKPKRKTRGEGVPPPPPAQALIYYFFFGICVIINTFCSYCGIIGVSNILSCVCKPVSLLFLVIIWRLPQHLPAWKCIKHFVKILRLLRKWMKNRAWEREREREIERFRLRVKTRKKSYVYFLNYAIEKKFFFLFSCLIFIKIYFALVDLRTRQLCSSDEYLLG